MEILSKNRKLALVCLCVITVLACVFGSMRSANALASKVTDAFSASNEKYVNVKDSLVTFSGYAHSFLNAYERVIGSDQKSRDFAAQLSVYDKEMSSPFLSVAPESLRVLAETMYTLAGDRDTSTSDLKYNYTSMKSLANQLAHNEPYNQAAEAYNKASSGFPASLFRKGEAVVFH